MESRSIIPTAPELPGRQRELARIRREIDRAHAGETRFLVLWGEAGIGKTRLLREVTRSSGAGADGLILGLHLPAARVSAEDLLEAWLTPVLRAAGRRAVGSDIALAALAYPRLRELHPVAEASSGQRVPKPRAIAAIARVLSEAADRRPLLVPIDDFPLLRPDVRRLVAELALGLAGAPAAFLVTARLGRGGADPLRDRALAPLREQHLLEPIAIGPLDRTGLEELVAAELDSSLGPAILPWLQAKSGGNPLFAVELIRALEGQGILYVDRESGRWRVAGPLSMLRLPDTIAHVLDVRRRALAPELSRALPVLALLGADAPASVLAPAIGIEPDGVDPLRQRLRRAAVLTRVGEGTEHEHDAFAHALMAEHWTRDLDVDARRTIVGRALGELMAGVASRPGSLPGGQPGSSATGLEQAGEEELQRLMSYAALASDTDAVVRSLIELGRRNLRLEQPRAAVICARRASTWLENKDHGAERRTPDDPERLPWLRGQVDFLLGSAWAREGRLAAAEVRLRRFLVTPEAADSVHGIYAFVRLGLLLVKRGRLEEARQVFESGIAALAHATTWQVPLIRCDLWAYLAVIDTHQGDFAAAEEHLAAAAAAIAPLRGNPRTAKSEMHLLHDRGMLAAERGHLRQAIADFERLIELEGAEPRGVQPEAIHGLAHFRMLVGDLPMARALLERAMRTARRDGNHIAVAVCYGTWSLLEAAAGNWPEALLAAERSRRLAEATQHRASWFQAMGELERIHDALGHPATSDRMFEEARIALGESAAGTSVLGDTGPRYFLYTRAWVLGRRGDWPGATRAREEAMAAAGKRQNPLVHAEIELLALEAAARGAQEKGAPRPADFQRRLSAVEAVLRTEQVRSGLVDLARVRLYAGLAGWDSAEPAFVLREIAGHLQAMQAEGRRREIAAEFSATPLAARRECTTVLEALAGTDSRVEGEASIVRSTPQALESLISPAEIGLPSDRLRITTFGRLAVMRAGESEPVSRSTWGSRKARLLLAYFLAADPESRGVTREALCEAVWPESDSLHLERTFRVTMTFLRRAVEAGGDSASATPPGASGARLLAFRDGRYRLACDGFWCDAREFDRLTAGAAASERGGDPVAALQKRGAAFELYQGEFLADFDEPWIEPRRERYRRQFVQIGTALFDAALAGGRREEAEEVAERIVACDPLAEEGHQLLIRAYLAAGRRDAAVRQLERCRTLLRTELGIEVSPRTAGLLGRDGSGR